MKIKFAVIGCGHIGKRHAELLFQHPDAELVATIDVLDKSSLQISDLNVPHFTSVDDFLTANIEVDVVNVCTPNGFHASQAIECLEKGKHVVIEKPIALDIASAKAILHVAGKHNKYVFPVVQNRYSSTIKWLKDIVSEGLLGKIFMVQLNCFWNRNQHYYSKGSWHGTMALDGGPLYTQFSHFIDILNWIFGTMTNVEAKFYNFNHQNNTEFEDGGVVTFDINGASGVLSYTTSVFQSNFESSITVIAENGTVKIGGQYMNSLEYCQIKGIDQPILDLDTPVNDYGSYKGSASNHQQVIENVIDVLNDLAKPDVSLQEGIDVVDSISYIYQGRGVEKIIMEREQFLV